MIRTLVLSGYYALAILTLGPIGIAYTLMVGSVDWLYWRAMAVAHFGLRLVGVRIHVIGTVLGIVFNDEDHTFFPDRALA